MTAGRQAGVLSSVASIVILPPALTLRLHCQASKRAPCSMSSPISSMHDANAYLVQMGQQVKRVLINAVGPGSLKLVLAVAARKQSYSQGLRPARSQQIPNAVPHND